MTRAPAPERDEFELTVLGPGYGESVVLHLGLGDWLVVDSCTDEHDRSAPLEYLKSIGVDAATAVTLILASHWHDDHVRGLSELVAASKQSTFTTSAALRNKEFLRLVEAYRGEDLGLTSERRNGLVEMAEVFQMLRERGKEVWKPAIAARRLWARRGEEPTAEVWSLSPSDHEFHRAIDQFVALNHQSQSSRLLLPHQRRPNDTATVLWVRVGRRVALLGSDLEDHGHAGLGWSAVLSDNERPKEPARYVKVPHHGSKSGDHPGIWSTLAEPRPVTSTTPFVNGSQRLPTDEDVNRILSLVEALYVTGDTSRRSFRHPNPAVRRTMGEVVKDISRRKRAPGRITLRCNATVEEPEERITFADGAVQRI